LKPTCVLLTGASSAIGRAIAKQLGNSWNLILHGRDPQKLAEVQAACARPEKHLPWLYDLTDTADIVHSLTNLLAEQQVAIEAFVHCAGILRLGAFRVLKPGVESDIFAVNFFSAVEIIRVLRSQTGGAVLKNVTMISSGASLFGEKGNVIYSASKGALDAFVKSLAMELAPEGRANSILPGMVEGGMSDQSRESDAYDGVIRRNYPLGLGKPGDIAAMVEFLLSEKARWITGQQILVDGGYSAHCNHVL
jgi:NAD(P)-dependent dehydrogenase (short-subunit alcohol dehydrogenase family)